MIANVFNNRDRVIHVKIKYSFVTNYDFAAKSPVISPSENLPLWMPPKMLSEVKPFKNISKNLQNFLETSSVQNEVLLSHKLQDHAHE